MTVTNTTRRTALMIPNGITRDWSFSIFWYSASTIEFWVRNAAGEDSLIPPSLYTLTPGPGNEFDGYAGGTITYPIAPAAPLSDTAQRVYISRTLPLTQTAIDLTYSSGFDPRAVERALDEIVMMQQQTADGAVVGGVVLTPNPEQILTMPRGESNLLIGWNGLGDALENKTPTGVGTVDTANVTATGDRQSRIMSDALAAGAGETIIFFASATGNDANDGITSLTPKTVKGAWDQLKIMSWLRPAATLRVQLAAGTYTSWTSCRTEGLAPTAQFVEFQGSVDGSGVPNVIFDGTSNDALVLGGGNNPGAGGAHSSVNLLVKNIAVQNFAAATPLNVWFNANVRLDNYRATGCAYEGASIRNGVIDIKNCHFVECALALSIQNCYGEVGSTVALEGAGCVFTDNTTAGVAITRGSFCYVRESTFSGNARHIWITHNARCRTVANTYGSYTSHVIAMQNGGIWNEDPDGAPDTFSSIPTRGPIIEQWHGAIADLYARGPNLMGHNRYTGATLSFTGTGIKQLNNTLSGGNSGFVPFNMPGYWMRQPNAYGLLRMEVFTPADETLLIQLTGSGIVQNPVTEPDANDVLADITLTDTSNRRWLVEMEIFGAVDGGTTFIRGISRAEGLGNSPPRVTNFTSSGLLSNTGTTSATSARVAYRVYCKATDGSSAFQFVWMQSYVVLG